MKQCPICLKRRQQAIQRLNAALMCLERSINKRHVKRVLKACKDWLAHDPRCQGH